MINKYIEAVKTAYNNNELYKLLGCKDEYIYDRNGSYYLNMDIRLAGISIDELDPINMDALLSAVEQFYCSLNKAKGEKVQFINELKKSLDYLLESDNALYLYFLAKIYFILAKQEEKDMFYPFKGIYKNLQKPLAQELMKVKTELLKTRMFEGKNKEAGLWEVLLLCNEEASDNVKMEVK